MQQSPIIRSASAPSTPSPLASSEASDAPAFPEIARTASAVPSLLERRRSSLPPLGINIPAPQQPIRRLKRPNITPLQRGYGSSGHSSPRSDQSVKFETFSFMGGQAMELHPSAAVPGQLPIFSAKQRENCTLFGFHTGFRPLWLLALGNVGSCTFGLGEVVLQRAIWPAKTYAGLNDNGLTVLPNGSADGANAFGSQKNDIVGGSILMAAGIAMALTACSLFVKDGRALNRRQNPANPNYGRTMKYYYTHLFGISLLVGHRFVAESFRLYLTPQINWVASLPSGVGQALFAITQAQSFSSCEIYYGKMQLKHRGLIGAAARAGISLYFLLACMISTPNFSSYSREIVRSLAQTATAVAYSLPLTTARLNAPPPTSPRVEHGPLRFRGDWTAMQIFFVYGFARLMGALSASLLAHARWPADLAIHNSAYANSAANATGWWGLPPPLPNLPPRNDDVQAASVLFALSSMLGTYAFLQFHRDRAGSKLVANFHLAGAILCLALGQAYRVMVEDGKSHANFERAWEAMPIGVVANALAFVIIPEMFSRSEVTQGNVEIKHRYQVTEACRAGGNLCITIWASMSAIQGFPPLVRQMMIWAGSVFTLLGLALPNATTRLHQTGSLGTPQGEPTSWLAAHTR